MTVATLSPALADLADAIQAEVGTAPPQIPSASPGPGQGRAEWLAEVEAARAEGDRLAAIVIDRLGLPVPEVSSIRDMQIPVNGGNLASRVYVPHGEGPFPAVVYFHGGAWWLAGGSRGFALNDSHCRILCAGAATVVVSVDYRLAPEFPYPMQLEDAFAAVRSTQMSVSSLEVDGENVSVSGTSSGGNLAAAVCLLARQRGGPSIAGQLLHVPALDLTLGSPSIQEDPATAGHLSAVIDLYATAEQRAEPSVSPLLADDLAGLPQAFIATGQHDHLRDDGRRYAERLSAAGTDAVWIDYPMFHTIALPETLDAMYADMISALRAFHR
jgi:acetyl esterase